MDGVIFRQLRRPPNKDPSQDNGWKMWARGRDPVWPPQDTLLEAVVESRAALGRRRQYVRNVYYHNGKWTTDTFRALDSDSVIAWRWIES